MKASYLLPFLATIVSCRIDDGGSKPAPSTVQFLNSLLVKTTLPPLGSKGRGRTGNTATSAFQELQLNLCNSGFAKCYKDGASVTEGGELIYKQGPNLVTLNEVCMGDVKNHLHNSLAEAWPDDYTYSVFMPAIDKRSNAAYKCKNGDLYGSAVMGRVAKSKWKSMEAWGGKYSTQDGSSNEQRIFVCAHATGDHVGCATHLAANAESTAMTQCKALLFDTVPYLRGLTGEAVPLVVGGDFNLKHDGFLSKVEVQDCVPNGYTRKGDSDVQHVIFANDLHFQETKKFDMKKTDHDGFQVKLTK